MALFAQLGGGIYTKAADVGADLVGKVEAGIPEDDPRNPAVIADLVGDNVGDCAGRGADIFESTAAENIGAMILGASVAVAIGSSNQNARGWVIFPLVCCRHRHHLLHDRAACGAQVGGERTGAGRWPRPRRHRHGPAQRGLLRHRGAGGPRHLRRLLRSARSDEPHWWAFGLAGLVGIANSIAFVYITQYYTSGTFRPVREIAEAAKTGPATVMISGLAVGFENTALPVFAIASRWDSPTIWARWPTLAATA